jgi:hypothetical protein
MGPLSILSRWKWKNPVIGKGKPNWTNLTHLDFKKQKFPSLSLGIFRLSVMDEYGKLYQLLVGMWFRFRPYEFPNLVFQSGHKYLKLSKAKRQRN